MSFYQKSKMCFSCKKTKCGCISFPPAPIPPPQPTNNAKAIGLFESDLFEGDKVIVDGIYFCWYTDETLPKFPIIQTDATVSDNLRLLDLYYQQGYRYFMGFSRSTICKGVLAWFLSHPDAIGISLSAGAPSLAIPKNIYRLISNAATLLNPLENNIENATNVYYIYSANEFIGVDFLNVLENDPRTKDKLKSYPVTSLSSYNVSDLTNFLSGSTSNDIILLGVFDPENYANLYNIGLSFPGNQYGIIGAILDVSLLTGLSATLLSEKYFAVLNTYPNTSLLWRKNYEYIINKYGSSAESRDIPDALKMIQYFLQKRNIQTLPAYSGTLQFDENNDLKYTSYLLSQYVKNGSQQIYVNSSITFDDPLLGKFDATFI
jgi:hypothetical protein